VLTLEVLAVSLSIHLVRATWQESFVAVIRLWGNTTVTRYSVGHFKNGAGRSLAWLSTDGAVGQPRGRRLPAVEQASSRESPSSVKLNYHCVKCEETR